MKTVSRRQFLGSMVNIPVAFLATKLLSCSDELVKTKIRKRIDTQTPLKIGSVEIWLHDLFLNQEKTAEVPLLSVVRENQRVVFRDKNGKPRLKTLMENNHFSFSLNQGTPKEENYTIISSSPSRALSLSVILEVEYSTRQ